MSNFCFQFDTIICNELWLFELFDTQKMMIRVEAFSSSAQVRSVILCACDDFIKNEFCICIISFWTPLKWRSFQFFVRRCLALQVLYSVMTSHISPRKSKHRLQKFVRLWESRLCPNLASVLRQLHFTFALALSIKEARLCLTKQSRRSISRVGSAPCEAPTPPEHSNGITYVYGPIWIIF